MVRVEKEIMQKAADSTFSTFSTRLKTAAARTFARTRGAVYPRPVWRGIPRACTRAPARSGIYSWNSRTVGTVGTVGQLARTYCPTVPLHTNTPTVTLLSNCTRTHKHTNCTPTVQLCPVSWTVGNVSWGLGVGCGQLADADEANDKRKMWRRPLNAQKAACSGTQKTRRG